MIDKNTVEYIAELARLELTEKEKESFAEEIDSILEHMKQLNDVDTEGIEPTSFFAPGHDTLRDDKVKESLSVEDALKNGPNIKKGFFAVPKVIG